MHPFHFSPEENRTLRIVVGSLCVLMVILYFLVPKHKPNTAPFAPTHAVSIVDYDGHSISLKSFRLKPLIVFSWATWSPYSADEFKNLMALKKTYGSRITILAINRGEPAAEAKSFTDKLVLGDTMTLALDPSDSYYNSVGGYAMPETIFISASGDETLHQRGPIDLVPLEEAIRQML